MDIINETPKEFDLSKDEDKTKEAQLSGMAEPLSPSSSSSSASQINSTDATFEPTIDMMVNDFDDEQTLNEEESLAANEAHDSEDEINTLKEESEMPLEELLAKYAPSKQQDGKINRSVKRRKNVVGLESSLSVSETQKEDVIVIDSCDEETETSKEKSLEDESKSVAVDCEMPFEDNLIRKRKSAKPRKSHLFDLYADDCLISIANEDACKASAALDSLYVEEDDEDAAEAEDGEDYIRKTIMVGNSYQAEIPAGLSQYGDILPYENEDKLIWEPSQVSEQEVEEYLLQVRDIKSSSVDEEATRSTQIESGEMIKDTNAERNQTCNKASDKINSIEGVLCDKKLPTASGSDCEHATVIKDDEQSLHLLVQCGYDFKEALRRKRLNAMPLTSSMGLWSEEECRKFEEGVQKFGKDFVKIRQYQVRTRSMRELVQFYYLWKKSDRRDHNFANSDTVDHMDLYLNEGGEYNSNAATGGVPTLGASSSNVCTLGARKTITCTQKNYSIMTGSSMGLTLPNGNRKQNQTMVAAAEYSNVLPTANANIFK